MSDMSGLRLLAVDGDDLKVISAASQDAVCKPADLVYESKRRRFRLEMNRYCWETPQTKGRPGHRARAVLSFEDVTRARARYLPSKHDDLVLSLLSVEWIADAENPPQGEVRLTFAGDGEMVLTVECLDATLVDVSQVWPTRNRPKHKD